LEERLGEGAVGVVYRAVHIGLEKSFAIKLLKTAGVPSPAALERFRKEAVALGRLRQPHIVEVTDCGIDGAEGGLPYIVTELLEGMPLSDVCRDKGPLPLTHAFVLLGQIAAAVDAAHEAGVLHRDLKPGNVFTCSKNPESPGVKVLDFGLAELLAGQGKSSSGTLPGGKASPIELTPTGSLLGTPLYAAPELILYGESSHATDIYSFGVLAYEILGGKPPFRGTLEEILASHLEADPPPLPLPPELWRPLRETLQKDPALRPDKAGEVIRRFQEGMLEAERACWASIEIPRPRRLQHIDSGSPRSEEPFDRPRNIHAVLAAFELMHGERFVYPRELFAEHRRLASVYNLVRAQIHAHWLAAEFPGFADLPDWVPEQDLGILQGRLRDLKSSLRTLESPFLELAETRAALAPGTVLLTYYVGESQSFLFVIEARGVPGMGLFLYPLSIGNEELKREVEAFRNLWGRPETNLWALKEHGWNLYDLLIRPAEPVLGKADRWLISPDGPLRSLPFATLFSGTHYLADAKPIYIAASYIPTEDGSTDLMAPADLIRNQDFSRPYYTQLTGDST